MEEYQLVVGPKDFTVATDLEHDAVIVRVDYDPGSAPWMAPGMTLAFGLTCEEARSLGLFLIRKAAELDVKAGR